jgi:hypothetical protein
MRELAQGARTILADPSVGRTMDMMRSHLTDKWVAEQDEMARDRIWYQVQALEDLRSLLGIFANEDPLQPEPKSDWPDLDSIIP